MSMSISIETVGRRHYLRGNTYPIREQIRAAGCKWDAAEKAWYSGKRETAESVAGSTAADAPQQQTGREAPGLDATVAGRAEYKGRTYYVAGRVARGRTHWDDTVEAVSSRDGSKILLYFRDGSSQFWAAREAVRVVKQYDRAQTIQRLRDYAERAKSDRETYGYVPRKGVDYCGYRCPVGGHICTPDHPCHDCE